MVDTNRARFTYAHPLSTVHMTHYQIVPIVATRVILVLQAFILLECSWRLRVTGPNFTRVL